MKKALILMSIPFVFFACKKDKDEPLHLSSSEITFHHSETAQLNLVPATTATWESEDTTVAKVSASGLVTAGFIGDTKVNARLTSGEIFTCNVHVTSVSNIYKEPITEWGQSVAYVKGLETRHFNSETEGVLLYDGENTSILGVAYAFDSIYLVSAMVMGSNTITYAQLKSFLDERYYFLEESTDDPDFTIAALYHNNEDTFIMVSMHSVYGVSVFYMDANLLVSKSMAFKQLKAAGLNYYNRLKN